MNLLHGVIIVKIVILCAMGMSSGILLKNVKKAASAEGIGLDGECYFCSNFKELDYKGVDCILMAPQVRNQVNLVKEYVKDLKTPVISIAMTDYGLMKGKPILDQILQAIRSSQDGGQA